VPSRLPPLTTKGVCAAHWNWHGGPDVRIGVIVVVSLGKLLVAREGQSIRGRALSEIFYKTQSEQLVLEQFSAEPPSEGERLEIFQQLCSNTPFPIFRMELFRSQSVQRDFEFLHRGQACGLENSADSAVRQFAPHMRFPNMRKKYKLVYSNAKLSGSSVFRLPCGKNKGIGCGRPRDLNHGNAQKPGLGPAEHI